MRQAWLAAGAALFVLGAACTSGPDEGVTELVTTAPAVTDTEAEPESEPRPPLPVVDPGPPAQGGPLDLELVAAGLDSPVAGTAPPGDARRLYIVEQGGRIRVLENGELLDEPYLDLSSRVSTGNEQGLLSLAFHPSFVSNGLFYVNYTDTGGDTRVLEFR
ncbi:MAG TPA: PQQ-dependent sugar dehydrogenase, partial [Gaiellaceae bacterium]|nr:PQQ-dependent sugar dehydrogenase [Gaiellaceae bacterium]